MVTGKRWGNAGRQVQAHLGCQGKNHDYCVSIAINPRVGYQQSFAPVTGALLDVAPS